MKILATIFLCVAAVCDRRVYSENLRFNGGHRPPLQKVCQ